MPQDGTMPPRLCERCQVEFIPRRGFPSRPVPRFCSQKCSNPGNSEKARIANFVSLEDRFWPKVNKNGPVPAHRPELGPCWVWTGQTDRRGYGRIAPGDGRHKTPASRIALEMALGRRLARKEEACHACDNPPCVRDSHLFLGTRKKNAEDMASKDRSLFGERCLQAKLTEDQVREIRRRHAAGESVSSLLLEFPITNMPMRALIARKTWKRVV